MKMTYEEFITQNPIACFSIYTHAQADAVIEMGVSIKEQFDTMIQDGNVVDMSNGDPYGKVWLWVVGAFEVVRTMSDPKWKASWSEDKYLQILEYKKRIADLRVPFAKQEYRSDKAINHENSIYEIDFEGKSYLYKIKEKVFNVRDEINHFEGLINDIQLDDVLHDLRDNQS
jgi:hypothetical protein